MIYTRMYIHNMDISARLDKAMEGIGPTGKNLSQSELHRRSGVSQATISRILKRTGTSGPEAETVKKLAAACNVTFEWLNEEIGPMRRDGSSSAAVVESEPDPDTKAILDMLLNTDSEGRMLAKNAVIEALIQYQRRQDDLSRLTGKKSESVQIVQVGKQQSSQSSS